ncbi:unnamed protein product [Dracunculus medinensis]|uniref:TYR_PHOSPHATASE_2 domain-containing protein n=1 Tax=Dracunculus medinensis TaxID=318479 RepID=A0A0N4UIR0_DRAME|nr:unnamed protein product [Dracunculus medinensis]
MSKLEKIKAENQRSSRSVKRWANYRAIGGSIPGTRFLPFKTPLHSHFFNQKSNIGPAQFFGVKTLVHYVEQLGKKIGLIIDLTATKRYYNSEEWSHLGIEYVKIECRGNHIHRQRENFEHFVKIVNDFLQRNIDNENLIGVHCTHGVNRTGYVICKYLIEQNGWNADDAISGFFY